jgi:hypothetical protein
MYATAKVMRTGDGIGDTQRLGLSSKLLFAGGHVTKLIEYTTSESAARASQVIGNLGHHHTVARCKARIGWAGVAVVSYFVLGEQIEVLLSAPGSAFDSKAFEPRRLNREPLTGTSCAL